MKIIDNRYKIKNTIGNNIYSESYKVIDLWNKDKPQFMRFYHYDIQNNLIEYFIEEFIELSNIKHENILKSKKFNVAKTVDTKKINMLLYYSISEYNNYPSLKQVNENLSLDDKLEVLIQIILAIDFLHFRGMTYKLLSPSQVFISKGNKIKMESLNITTEKAFNSRYTDFERQFISSELGINNMKDNKKIDYYSLGNVIKYMFSEDISLTKKQREFLINIATNLTKKDSTQSILNLNEILDEIIKAFKLDYAYDLTRHREVLYINSKTVGRRKEISKVMEIDRDICNGINNYKGVLVEGSSGVGKTKFLEELSHVLKMKGRDVYSVAINKSKGDDLLDISNILKQSIQDTSSNLIDEYREEFSQILPELNLNMELKSKLDLNLNTERYRLYNRIANYFKEFSKNRIIYIIIDDLQNCNDNIFQLLDYLLNNMKSRNIFFVFSYDSNLNTRLNLGDKIEKWLASKTLMDIKIHRLDLEEIGLIIKNILGMGTVPLKLSSVLFKETQGNPRHIESLVKHLYNSGQLYMNKKGSWHITVDDYSELYIPTNIDEMTLKQLKVIRDKYYEVFKLMSIFNDFLHKKMILKILNIEADELEFQLEELIRLKLIDEKLVDWGYSYSINNIELKKMIYFQIPEEEKIKLHKSAIEALLSLKGENMDLIFEELIYHLIKSEQDEEALSIILEKIENLENKYGSQGIYLLEKAYNISKNINNMKRLEILGKLNKIYYTRGKLDDINPYLKEYKSLSIELKELKDLIRAKTIYANIYYLKNQLDLSFEEIKKIEKIADENHITEGKIICLSLKARFNLQKGQLDKGEIQLTEGLQISKDYEIDDYKSILYNRLGVARFLRGDIVDAIKYYEKSIYYYNKDGNFIDATRPINNIGNLYMTHYGNAEKAMEYYEKGLSIASKYDIKEIETIFLHNLGIMFMDNYEYDKAYEYTLKAKENASQLHDLNGIFINNANLGLIYLYTSKYGKAYNIYKYLKNEFQSGNITNIESIESYHEFMMIFYTILGKWNKALEHSTIKEEMYKETNKKEYLKCQSNILYIKYFKNNYFNENQIRNIINKYKDTVFYQDRRKMLLMFSAISIFEGHIEYGFKILNEDKKIKELAENKSLDKIRNTMIYYMNPGEDNIDRLISIEEYFKNNNRFPMKVVTKFLLGSKLFSENQYKDSIKYFIESLDTIYRDMLKIPNLNLRFSFIKSRKTDCIKAKLVEAIKKAYGETIEYTKLEDVEENELNDYFDIGSIVEVLGNEEYSKIIQFNSYDEVLNINSIEELMGLLTEDYGHNLKLILKYIGKETLASKAYLVKYNNNTQEYTIASSMDNKNNYKLNENMFKLFHRSKESLLINNDTLNINSKEYQEFLSDDIRGIMCIPIGTSEKNMDSCMDRRKKFKKERKNTGYIYLETDKVFNRFNKEKLELISKVKYLAYINLENNKLKIEATTDKLTGIYTRKYFDQVFSELINNTKVNDESFSLLMLDIDRFKSVNDNYGHQKGDMVLQEIGKILKSNVRSTDIVARYGGEEFTILLKDIGKEESRMVAEKIRRAICSLRVDGIKNPITISIGISTFPIHSQFKEELIEKADQALYYAKETGRNKVCLWDYSMASSVNRADKLAGILTGNPDIDSRNILAMLNTAELIKEEKDIEHKIFEVLGSLLDVVDAEKVTLIAYKGEKTNYYTRVKFNEKWIETPSLNEKIINKVKENKKGEFLIDWDNLEDVDTLSGLPNWESIIVLPLLRKGDLKGVLYLTSHIKTKEFDFNSYNLSRSFANIFAGIL